MLESALIHRARQVGSERGAVRSAQGAYERVATVGPWIPARLMVRGSVAPKTRDPAGVVGHVQSGYELLLGTEDETGAAVDAPTASSVFETDCPVLDSPTVALNGKPELMNNGEERIGWLCFADVPGDSS